ncbi:MAG TPA: glycosyltransferase family protein [Solirubrobacter sp.]|nr:glycosyltransferase family protein [Solirubrobacter sp.]
MHRVAIVQCRMTSTRLPGKVLADLGGKPLLERQLERLARCRRLDEIVLATTVNAADDPLVALGARLGIGVHRGSEHDVLRRYAEAAARFRADVVVRITSDCPLLDPVLTDAVVDALDAGADYASNALEPGLPRGLDAEALWRDVLDRVDRMATSAPAREHVTWHVHAEHPERFVLRSVPPPFAAGDLRLTVDTPEDLALVRRLDDELGPAAGAAELVAWLRAHPEVAALNAATQQKPY